MNTYTKSSRAPRHLLAALFSVIASLSLSAADPESELEQVKREFLEVKGQLETIMGQAMDSETVMDAVENQNEILKSELLDVAPEKSDTIEAYFETRTEIVETDETQHTDQVEALRGKMNQLASEIDADLREANQSESVKIAKQATKEAIITAMNEIDPETNHLIERQNQLYQRFRELTSQS